jgi:hypothetical protein
MMLRLRDSRRVAEKIPRAIFRTKQEQTNSRLKLADSLSFLYSAAMLSVVIETRNDEDALARTLASLVGAAVEGVVRDVIVCDHGSTDQTHKVAEHAGCHYVADGGAAAGIRQAKGEWLLLLEPGARLVDGWTDAVAEHVARLTMPARFTRARDDRASIFARVFSAPSALAEGLVIRKGQAVSLSRTAASTEAIARGLASKRLRAEPSGWRNAAAAADRQGCGRPPRRRCSSSRGMISTKLQGMCR